MDPAGANGTLTVNELELHLYSDLPTEDQIWNMAMLVTYSTVAETKGSEDGLRGGEAWRQIPTLYIFWEGEQALPKSVQETIVQREERAGVSFGNAICRAGHSPWLG